MRLLRTDACRSTLLLRYPILAKLQLLTNTIVNIKIIIEQIALLRGREDQLMHGHLGTKPVKPEQGQVHPLQAFKVSFNTSLALFFQLFMGYLLKTQHLQPLDQRVEKLLYPLS